MVKWEGESDVVREEGREGVRVREGDHERVREGGRWWKG